MQFDPILIHVYSLFTETFLTDEYYPSRVFFTDRHNLIKRLFLSRNYRLIVARGNLLFLKQIFRFEGKYASHKNIKFPRGNYQPDSSET